MKEEKLKLQSFIENLETLPMQFLSITTCTHTLKDFYILFLLVFAKSGAGDLEQKGGVDFFFPLQSHSPRIWKRAAVNEMESAGSFG